MCGFSREIELERLRYRTWPLSIGQESVPGKRSGTWVFRNTRPPVSVVFDHLKVGASIDEIMDRPLKVKETALVTLGTYARMRPSLNASTSRGDVWTQLSNPVRGLMSPNVHAFGSNSRRA